MTAHRPDGYDLAYRLADEGKEPRKGLIEAVRLKRTGLTLREVGERMGVSTSLASELLNDPTGEAVRRRKDVYRFPCERCGEMTNPGGLRAGSSRCCAVCSAARNAERNAEIFRRWDAGETRPQITAAMGIADAAVHAAIEYRRELGLPIAMHRIGGGREERRERRERVLRLHELGRSAQEIADECGYKSAESARWALRTIKLDGV